MNGEIKPNWVVHNKYAELRPSPYHTSSYVVDGYKNGKSQYKPRIEVSPTEYGYYARPKATRNYSLKTDDIPGAQSMTIH